jgi:hypothetical protein
VHILATSEGADLSTFLVAPVSSLTLLGVFDRGVPNQERVVLHAAQAIEMGSFGMLIGIEQSPGLASPVPDLFFWFGPGVTHPDSYILVYSGPGKSLVTTLQGTDKTAYVAHWGRESTLFANSRVVPMLISIDGVTVGVGPQDLPQQS